MVRLMRMSQDLRKTESESMILFEFIRRSWLLQDSYLFQETSELATSTLLNATTNCRRFQAYVYECGGNAEPRHGRYWPHIAAP